MAAKNAADVESLRDRKLDEELAAAGTWAI